jgi:hypothetical protein
MATFAPRIVAGTPAGKRNTTGCGKGWRCALPDARKPVAAKLVLQALAHVWTVLGSVQIPAAVMGGLALAAWKHVRATQDVDLLLGVDQRQLQPILAALAKAGVRPRRNPPLLTLGSFQIVQLLYAPPDAFVELQVDLVLADSEYHRAALARRISMRLPELEIAVDVLSCEDLILHKLIAGRILDQADVVALLRANRGAIDRAYLQTWSNRLRVQDELRNAWTEALPNVPPPDATSSG